MVLDYGKGIQKTRDEIGGTESTNLIIDRFSEKISIKQGPFITETLDVGGDTLWGLFNWGESDWDGTFGALFILGSAEYGVLGTNRLGDSEGEYVIYAVHNINDVFEDRYELTKLVDSTPTTATHSTNKYDFTSGQILQSTTIAKDTRTFTTALPDITIDSGSFDIYLSADGGTSWQLATNNTETTFTVNNYGYSLYTDNVLYLDLSINPSSGTVDDLSSQANDGTFKINATAYYPFNGNANDESINSNNCTVTGATLTTDHLGNANNAYNFDGTDDYIGDATPTYTIDTSAEGYTLGGWFYVEPNATASWQALIMDDVGSGQNGANFGLMSDTNGTSVGAWAGGNHGTGAMATVANGWHHIVGVYTASATFVPVKMYVDGVYVGTSVTDRSTPFSGTIKLAIGNSYVGYNTNLKGKVSEAFFLKGVSLTDDEVLNLYNATSVHKLDKPLVTKTDGNGVTKTGYEFFSRGTFLQTTSTITRNSSTQAFSMYAWIRYIGGTYVAANVESLIIGERAAYGITIQTNGTVKAWVGGNANAYSLGGTDLNDGNWHFIGVEWLGTGATRNIYIDNQLVGTDTTGTAGTYNYIKYVGGEETNHWSGFHITTPLIFNRVLTSDERDKLFNDEYFDFYDKTTWTASTGTDIRYKTVCRGIDLIDSNGLFLVDSNGADLFANGSSSGTISKTIITYS